LWCCLQNYFYSSEVVSLGQAALAHIPIYTQKQ
jgi:hypothetical protein